MFKKFVEWIDKKAKDHEAFLFALMITVVIAVLTLMFTL